jgi:ATP-dependent Zn protease
MMAIEALLRLLTSVLEVRRRDIGLSTDPMRSITDSGTVLGKVSERTRQRVDEVVKRIVGEAHDQAARLLADNRDRLAMRSPRR